MVRFAYSMNDLSFGKLMTVYEESNLNNVNMLYPHMDKNAAIHVVEQAFYAYLKDVFFKTKGACCAVLEENDQYCSIVRTEPYLDGVILTGLETAPKFRRMGYATRLYTELLKALPKAVYVHVCKDNHASLLLHKKFGFSIVDRYALYLDGSRSEDAYTLRRNLLAKEIAIDK